MSEDEQVPVSTGIKLISLLLMVGGVVGGGLTFWLEMNSVSSGQIRFFSPAAGVLGAFIVLFGWAAWTGRNLWLGKRSALTQAKILFGIQVPLFQVPGFAYEFHTGLTVPIKIAGGLHFSVGFNFGSSFSFYISSQTQDFAFGLNLVALFVIVYLVRISRPLTPAQDKFGLI